MHGPADDPTTALGATGPQGRTSPGSLTTPTGSPHGAEPPTRRLPALAQGEDTAVMTTPLPAGGQATTGPVAPTTALPTAGTPALPAVGPAPQPAPQLPTAGPTPQPWVPAPHPAPAPVVVERQRVYYVDQAAPHDSTASWMAATFLAALPLIGLIYIIAVALGASPSHARRSWARALLVWMTLGALLTVAAAVWAGSALWGYLEGVTISW